MDRPDLVMRIPVRPPRAASSRRSFRRRAGGASWPPSARCAIACCSPSSIRPAFVSARSAASASRTSTRLACSCTSVRARDIRTVSLRSLPSPSICFASGGAPLVQRACCSPTRTILSRSIRPATVQRAVKVRRAPGRHHQARLSPHAAPLVRHTPDGAGHEHARHSGPARPRPQPHHRDLHARLAGSGAQSSGSDPSSATDRVILDWVPRLHSAPSFAPRAAIFSRSSPSTPPSAR